MQDEFADTTAVEVGAEENGAGDQVDAGIPDLTALLESLDSRLAESQRLLSRQTDLTDQLHAENQALRVGELRAAQAPLIRDLLRLHDDLTRMREAANDGDGDLRLVQESLIDTLARNGIEVFIPALGEGFESGLHSAAGVDSTDDPELDRTIAEVLKPGFRWDFGEVIRVAEVRAFRHRGDGQSPPHSTHVDL